MDFFMRERIFLKSLFLSAVLVATLCPLFSCSGNNSPNSPIPTPTPAAPTPTPIPTITVGFSYNLMDFGFNSSGDDCEAQNLFLYFTNYGANPVPMAAPCTQFLTGYIGSYSPNLLSYAISMVNTTGCAYGSGQNANLTFYNMPATLGQSLTWTTHFSVPSADQTQASTNGLPANIYTNTSSFPSSLVWQLDAFCSYSYAGSAYSLPFGSSLLYSAPISNLSDLQAPQTVILNIPSSVP